MGTLSDITIGFIGLGLMGRPISLNLHRAGAELIIYNRSRGVVDEPVGVGIEAATSPKDVAERAPIIMLMVSDTPAVERVLFGDDGVAQGLQTGAIVIDMGTTAVTATRNFAQQIKAKGAHYVDAPVSGGQVGAEAATLAIMVGASEDAFARAKPIFKVLAKNITHVGEVGAGQVAKAANQIIVGLTIGAVAEALALAKRAGVDPAKVRQALAGGFAASRILEVHGLRMVDQTFDPGGKRRHNVRILRRPWNLLSNWG